MKIYEVRITRTTETVHTITARATSEMEAQKLAKENLDENRIAPDWGGSGFRIIDEDIKIREIGGEQ